jgi:hypothetical protein
VSSGYLKVLYQGVWGLVCVDGWTHHDSYVACGHLGYPDVHPQLNDVPPQQPDDVDGYWMSDVDCDGTEATNADMQVGNDTCARKTEQCT